MVLLVMKSSVFSFSYSGCVESRCWRIRFICKVRRISYFRKLHSSILLRSSLQHPRSNCVRSILRCASPGGKAAHGSRSKFVLSFLRWKTMQTLNFLIFRSQITSAWNEVSCVLTVTFWSSMRWAALCLFEKFVWW